MWYNVVQVLCRILVGTLDKSEKFQHPIGLLISGAHHPQKKEKERSERFSYVFGLEYLCVRIKELANKAKVIQTLPEVGSMVIIIYSPCNSQGI